MLGITINSSLNFRKHINNFFKRASSKLNALARISGYMGLPKRRMRMKLFITSHFGHCSMIWMFHGRQLNDKINSIHEKSLRITYYDSKWTFEESLDKENSASIRHRNLHVLATEMFKMKNITAPELLNEDFQNKILP